MRFKHKTLMLVLPVLLIAFFALTGCDDGENKSPVDGGGTGNTAAVSTVEIELGTSTVSGYYGSADTIRVNVTALGQSGNPIENADITVVAPGNVGRVVYPDGRSTSESGQMYANYIVTHTQDRTVTLFARAGSVESSDVTLNLASEDVRVVISANPTTDVVGANQTATSQIKVRVNNMASQPVVGVPVNIEILNDVDATLSSPTFNEEFSEYRATLTASDIQGEMQVEVRAYIDLPAGASISSIEGKGASLPVMQPGQTEAELDVDLNDGGSRRAGSDTPAIQSDGLTRKGGKGSRELPTWTEESGKAAGKGARAGIAAVTDADTVTVTWTTWGSTISDVFLSINPDRIAVIPDSSGEATVNIVAKDENNNGIPGRNIYLGLENVNPAEGVGTISNPDSTDQNGRTSAIISTNGQYGTWVVSARTSPSAAPQWFDTLTVVEGSEVVSAFMRVSPNVLYVEPENSGRATVTMIAYDENNNGVANYRLYTRLSDMNGNPVGGTINNPDSSNTTNAAGVDTTVINTNGDYGDWQVQVFAYKNAINPLATRTLSVREGSSIASMTMTITPDEINAEPGTSKKITVRATAKDENNNGLRNRRVYFSLQNPDNPGSVGSITESDTTDSSGVTRAIINTDGEYGTWVVEARAYPSQPEPMATKTVTVNLGTDVTDISVTVSPDVLTPAPEVSDTANVYIVANDNAGTGVKNIVPYLSIRSIDGSMPGSISQPDSTGSNGVATAKLLTNGRYGTWVVEASPYEGSEIVGMDTVRVLEGIAQYITVSADTNRIASRGTNGIEQTTVRATVYDENDVPVQDGQMVYFRVEAGFPYDENTPARFQINDSYGQNSPYDDPFSDEYGLPFDSAMVNNGEATVEVTSGTKTGLVNMMIWTYDPETGDQISTLFSGLQVVNGPPANIDVSGGTEGFDGGAQRWEVEITADVTDVNNNPVGNGYQVFFTVEPDIVSITTVGFTGNEGEHSGESSEGTAFSTLRYASQYTNETVTITAWVLDQNGNPIEASTDYKLPIQEAVGLLLIVPSNWDFDNGNNEPMRITCQLDVRDGHDIPINNQRVLFSPERGEMYDEFDDNPDLDQPLFLAITGPAEIGGGTDPIPVDPVGSAVRYWIGNLSRMLLDNENTQNVNLNASIVGASDATVEPATITLFR